MKLRIHYRSVGWVARDYKVVQTAIQVGALKQWEFFMDMEYQGYDTH